MKKLLLPLLICLTPFAVEAIPLKVVNVSAPAINCVFNPTCTVTVNDTSDNIPMSTGGTGFLQSRTYIGAPGSPAAGLFAYEYRIDLRNAVGAVAISCIDSMTISFGPVVSSLNFGGSAAPDQVFVVTGGGIGTIGHPRSRPEAISSSISPRRSAKAEHPEEATAVSSGAWSPRPRPNSSPRHCTKPAAPRTPSKRARRNSDN